MKSLSFRSSADLVCAVKKNVWKLPDDLDLIVCIPRSGLLPGGLISLIKNLPVTDIVGLEQGYIFESGFRFQQKEKKNFFKGKKKILIVDDSSLSGSQIRKTKKRIEKFKKNHELLFFTVYASLKSKKLFDFFCETVEYPRIFEWNLLNSKILENCCVDIDGVLCRDPTNSENDDAEKYIDFIKFVKPRIVPKYEIRCLVTSRLEKYRNQTEIWLNQHQFKYQELRMLDLPNQKIRKLLKPYAKFKAEVYLETDALLFIESTSWQAKKIFKLTGRPVFCVEHMEMMKVRDGIISKLKGLGVSKSLKKKWKTKIGSAKKILNNTYSR